MLAGPTKRLKAILWSVRKEVQQVVRRFCRNLGLHGFQGLDLRIRNSCFWFVDKQLDLVSETSGAPFQVSRGFGGIHA